MLYLIWMGLIVASAICTACHLVFNVTRVEFNEAVKTDSGVFGLVLSIIFIILLPIIGIGLVAWQEYNDAMQ